MPPPYPPPRLRPGRLLERSPVLPRLKNDLKAILFFDRFSIPFWNDLGSDLGAMLDHGWHSNRPKFRPKCLSKPYFFKNTVFMNPPPTKKTMDFHYCWPQDRPQNDPRQAQDGSKRLLKAYVFCVEFCVRFWSDLEAQNGAQIDQKSLRNQYKMVSILWLIFG